LLAVAIAKTGDEDKMFKTYRAAGGRRDLTRLVTGNVAPTVATRFQGLSDLIHYWRDATAHGTHTTIGEVEANMSLSQLLRLAQLTSDNWNALTSP
jgi:hypothetical protein